MLQGSEPAGERVFFSRNFPGSAPPYFEVVLSRDGQATYREEPEEEDPLGFTLRAQEVAAVFDLVERLDYLRKPIASKKKVAFTGDKICRYENGAERSEVSFVFTNDKDARELVVWFQRMSESGRHRIELERVVQFDRLGVNKTLLVFQTAFDKDRIVAADQFLPVLKTIASQEKFVHIARTRAASLVERIEAMADGR
jgi:hypothetical protein